jgi:hypothetical protein
VITENGFDKTELLWLWGQKTRDILKGIEIVEENWPIWKLEIKYQVSHKIQFFLLMMDLERSETRRG